MLSSYHARVVDLLEEPARNAVLHAIDADIWVGREEIKLSGILSQRDVSHADLVVFLLRLGYRDAVESLIGKRILVRALQREPPIYVADKTPDSLRVLRMIKNTRLPSTPAYARMRVVKPGMSVRQMLVRGVTRRDLRIARNRGELEYES